MPSCLPPFGQHPPNTPPGFLQGIRRIVAVTAQDAAAAIAKGDQLAARVGQAARLEGKPLEAELTDLKVVSWQHSCGAAHRAGGCVRSTVQGVRACPGQT